MLNLLEMSLFVEKKFIFVLCWFNRQTRNQKTCRKLQKYTKIAGANLEL